MLDKRKYFDFIIDLPAFEKKQDTYVSLHLFLHDERGCMASVHSVQCAGRLANRL